MICFFFLFLSLGAHDAQETVGGDCCEADEEDDNVNVRRIKPESNLVKNKKMKYMNLGKIFNIAWKKINWNDFHLCLIFGLFSELNSYNMCSRV